MPSGNRPGGVMARTLSVSPKQPGAFPTIRDALEVATDDSVISIAPGTYAEALALDGRRISLLCNGEVGSAMPNKKNRYGKMSSRPRSRVSTRPVTFSRR